MPNSNSMGTSFSNTVSGGSAGGAMVGASIAYQFVADTSKPQIPDAPKQGLERLMALGREKWDKLHNNLLSALWDGAGSFWGNVNRPHTQVDPNSLYRAQMQQQQQQVNAAMQYGGQIYQVNSQGQVGQYNHVTQTWQHGVAGANVSVIGSTAHAGSQQTASSTASLQPNPDGKLAQNIAKLASMFYQGGSSA